MLYIKPSCSDVVLGEQSMSVRFSWSFDQKTSKRFVVIQKSRLKKDMTKGLCMFTASTALPNRGLWFYIVKRFLVLENRIFNIWFSFFKQYYRNALAATVRGFFRSVILTATVSDFRKNLSVSFIFIRRLERLKRLFFFLNYNG